MVRGALNGVGGTHGLHIVAIAIADDPAPVAVFTDFVGFAFHAHPGQDAALFRVEVVHGGQQGLDVLAVVGHSG